MKLPPDARPFYADTSGNPYIKRARGQMSPYFIDPDDSGTMIPCSGSMWLSYDLPNWFIGLYRRLRYMISRVKPNYDSAKLTRMYIANFDGVAHGIPWTVEDLQYAAFLRCLCGFGMAYVKSINWGRNYWDCSGILIDKADVAVKHQAKLPFVFYEIKSDNQPSANGATTREKIEIK